jgi:FkbM family methyltransferase
MISYAQNNEDVMLERVFKGRTNGFYIDVGAADPVVDSVTKWFYENGWSGVNIEPNPHFYERLLADRPRDINLDLALDEREDEKLFHVFEKIGNSTFDESVRNEITTKGFESRPKMVQVTTLSLVCRNYAHRQIDFLKVDCEGWERQVLQGGDWMQYRPTVVLVEGTAPGRPDPTWQNWEPWFVKEAHYEMVFFDGLNRFYLRRENLDLRKHFEVPANVFDNFRLHSLVAVEQERDAIWRDREEILKRLWESEANERALAESHGSLKMERAETQRLAEELRVSEAKAEELETGCANLRQEIEQRDASLSQTEARLSEAKALLVEVEARLFQAGLALAAASQQVEKGNALLGQQASELEISNRLVSDLENKLRDARLWIGRLSQEIAALRSEACTSVR